MPHIYDQIGTGYSQTRRADPRIAAAIHRTLGSATSVLNVGAGAGSYEPNGLDVVAIHHHMTQTQPTVFFLHYWGTGPTEKLATGFKAALAELGKSPATSATHH